MTKGKAPKHKIIGWREWVSLPELGVTHLKAKVDTGARTSALHATGIRYGEDAGGKFVSFTIVTEVDPRVVVRVRAPLVEKRRVRSSSGQASLRPVVTLNVAVGRESWATEVTLVNRDPMGFRMLLGRRTIKGRFVVHPGRSFIQSESKDS